MRGYFSLGLPVAFKVSVDWPCLVVSVIDVPLGSMFSRVLTVIPIASISLQGSMLYIIVPSSASAWTPSSLQVSSAFSRNRFSNSLPTPFLSALSASSIILWMKLLLSQHSSNLLMIPFQSS